MTTTKLEVLGMIYTLQPSQRLEREGAVFYFWKRTGGEKRLAFRNATGCAPWLVTLVKAGEEGFGQYPVMRKTLREARATAETVAIEAFFRKRFPAAYRIYQEAHS